MRVLMISTDGKILDDGSAVRARMIEYGTICEELNIIVVGKPKVESEASVQQISTNVFVYPAFASNRVFALLKSLRIGVRIPTIYYLRSTSYLVTSQDPFETGFFAWLIAGKIGAKLELQIHTDFLSPYFWKESIINKIRVMLARFLLPRSDGIRVVSERIRNSLKTKNLKLKTNPAVLPIFVDIEKIKNTPPSFDLHKKYPQFDFIILMASRLTKEKNINLAIEAMSEIVKKHPRTGLVIVGSGPEEKSLKLKTKNLKLENSIIFESWTNDIMSYYKTADMFLLTSNYEGFGLTLVEAAASGCPIVTTNVGIVGDILRRKQDILVCPVGDVNCLSDQIKRIMDPLELHNQRVLKAQISIDVQIKTKNEYLATVKNGWTKVMVTHKP